MLFALIADDRPGALEVRKANRPAHLDYLHASGVVTQAGALLDDTGTPAGSLVILDVPDRAAAEAWAAADPYAKAGLFAAVTIRPWNRVIG
ncbi:MAG: YciI family protein [Amaricoccus sp.]